jgi:hypothetical protein
MSKFYTYDAWVREFQPMPNHLHNQETFAQLSYETYGDEDEYVRQQDNNFVWTEVDGEEGCYIISGYHWVNRIQYYITNRPWTDDYTEVPTWGYRDCDCRTEANDWEEDPDCLECGGEGIVDIPVATVEDLQVIYGKNVEIVG